MISVFVATFIYYGFIVEMNEQKEQRKQEKKKYIFYSNRKFNK